MNPGLSAAGSAALAAAAYFAPPERARPAFWRRCLSLGSVAGLHLLGLLLAAGLAARADPAQPLRALTVRVLETAPAPPKAGPPRPKPAAAQPGAPPVPPPVLTAAGTAATVSPFAVAPQPEPRPAESYPAPPAALPVAAARFDADYLQNPKPVYPPVSRRLGEEGKVVLRVRVGAQGASLAVEVRQSSGHPRLDEAARAAVEKWRFVPARQGGEAVEATVLVPLHFTLDG